MWPRKQLDIGWSDLAFGLSRVLAVDSRLDRTSVVDSEWMPPEEALIALSARSGWDLLLSALKLPRGSEVLVSAVTIPDMVRIIEQHGLVPVPIDVDAERLEPSIEQLERAITSQTRAILVAHLFGTRIDMAPIIDLARQNGLLIVEDCAQAFVGHEYCGHAESDCALFSFGPIKTATALGGAVVRVRDDKLRGEMAKLQSTYPVQRRAQYFRRVLKYAGFQLLGHPANYGLMVRLLTAVGIDYDEALGNAAHSFAASDFFAQIRRQPCLPLVRMLARRIGTFDGRGRRALERRTWRGDRLARALPAGMIVGDQNSTHTYWVVPLRVANLDEVLAALRAAGFDATAHSSLMVVPDDSPSPRDSPRGRGSELEPPLAPWLSEIVFLPNGDDMPDREWERLMTIVQETARPTKLDTVRELVALPSVSV